MTSVIITDLEKIKTDVEASVSAHLKTIDASAHAAVLNFLTFFKSEVSKVQAEIADLESQGYTVTKAVAAVEAAVAAVKAV